MLSDISSEKAILAGIYSYGSEGFLEVADLIHDGTFTNDFHRALFLIFKDLTEKKEFSKFDIASIHSVARELGFSNYVNNKSGIDTLSSITHLPVHIKNIRTFAAKIKKLEIARLLYNILDDTKGQYAEVTGNETLSKILGIAEESIFNFISTLNESNEGAERLFNGVAERIEYRKHNVISQVGISTGYSRYDMAIGMGLRRGTVNVIGGRPKTKKSTIGNNIGIHIAKNLNIPVLNLDTEMRSVDHENRILSLLSGIKINEIETGQFSRDPNKVRILDDLVPNIKDIPYYYYSIGNCSFEEQMSILRRWIVRHVGLRSDGKANDCVVIYDYLKLTDSSQLTGNLQEFQALGFLMTSLHNFALRYDIPILAFIQLNRDGITKESTDTASGSDRIIWLCSNFTIFKRKSDDEISVDGPQHGTLKLVPIVSRHGEGLPFGTYINLIDTQYPKIIEGKTNLEIQQDKARQTEEDVSFD